VIVNLTKRLEQLALSSADHLANTASTTMTHFIGVVQRGQVLGHPRRQTVSGEHAKGRVSRLPTSRLVPRSCGTHVAESCPAGHPYDPAHDLLLMDGAWPNHQQARGDRREHRIPGNLSDTRFMTLRRQGRRCARDWRRALCGNWG